MTTDKGSWSGIGRSTEECVKAWMRLDNGSLPAGRCVIQGIGALSRGPMVDRAGFEPAYGKPGQIYSLLPLTTRPPVQRRPDRERDPMAKGPDPVNGAAPACHARTPRSWQRDAPQSPSGIE